MIAPYINCFTGSITHVLNQPGLSESDFLLFGDGFLLTSGLDEYGFPELVFNVVKCGELALKRFEVDFNYFSPNEDIDFKILRETCAENTPGIIVWTNSSHLAYSSLYSKNMGYLHCIVIKQVNDRYLTIFDPLVVDIPPYAMNATLSFENAQRALTDTAKMNARGAMGSLLKIHEKNHIDINPERKHQQMLATAHNFLNSSEFYNAIQDYIKINQSAYDTANIDQKKYLSRRIFDHIQVLYVIPLLELLKAETQFASLKEKIDIEIAQWRSIAMMALKNSKIPSERLFDKIIENLNKCSQLRYEYWSGVVDNYILNHQHVLANHAL